MRARRQPAQAQPGDVMKFAMPRNHLHVTHEGVVIQPGLVLGSWAPFKQMAGGAMGDLVLTEDEVRPATSKLQEGVSGQCRSQPSDRRIARVLYMHIPATEAPRRWRKQFTSARPAKAPPPDSTPAPSADLGFDPKQGEQVLGHAGKVKGGILRVSVPRAEPISDCGMTVAPYDVHEASEGLASSARQNECQ
jgi:hypothetical protein